MIRGVAAAFGMLVLLGCSPSEPILFAGTLEDQLGAPVPGATVVIEAYEQADVPGGQAPPVAFRAQTTTAADGTFEFRIGPTEELRQLRIRNRGPLSFMAVARVGNVMWSFPFVRDMDRDGWSDSVTPVRWRPGT